MIIIPNRTVETVLAVAEVGRDMNKTIKKSSQKMGRLFKTDSFYKKLSYRKVS